MKKNFLPAGLHGAVLFLFMVTQSVRAQVSTTNEILLDTIIKITERHSVYADQVDWTVLRPELFDRLSDGDSLEALIAPVEHLFAALGDFHGGLLLRGNRYNGYYKTEYPYPVELSIIHAIQQGGSQVEAKMLENDIAYLKIPHLYLPNPMEEVPGWTTRIRAAVCSLQEQKPKGWIIDLRTNLGGNVYPMLAGLGPLFPNLALGGDTQDGNTYHSEWELREGNFYMWGSPMTNVPLDCGDPKGRNLNETTKVAVLTGRYTASSGEALASAFKAQSNVRLFGEITSGWSSTTGWFPLQDEVILLPTVAYFMSRDGTVHRDGIHPDVEVEEAPVLDQLTTGAIIEAAKSWLQK